MIPFADPGARFTSRRDRILASVARVIDSRRYVLGEEVGSFESEILARVGGSTAVGVANGTDALTVALSALGVGPGDEVITVSLSAVATAVGILRSGARPVFVDVEEETLVMDPTRLETVFGPRVRAIVPVHLYGRPVDMDAVMTFAAKRGILVVEDCAQAFGGSFRGKPLGSFGDAATFSFYPTKNLGAIGDGGMVVLRDGKIGARARRLREYGWNGERSSVEIGMNSRLDELQAAILRDALADFDEDQDRRRALASRYGKALSGLPVRLPVEPEEGKHAWHLYPVRTRNPETRDGLMAALREKGFAPGVHYARPIHSMPAYRNVFREDDLSRTDAASVTLLSLPLFPELRFEDQERCIRTVRGFLGASQ